jgi:Cof subfamily protein (haloacid dehalogenase superfamily)
MDAMTRLFVRQLRVTLPIIACNWAVIRDCTTNELLEQTCIPADDVVALTGWLKREGLDFLVYTPDAVYYLPESRRIDVMHQYNRRAMAAGQSLVPLHELNNRTRGQVAPGAVKILAIIPDASAMAALEAQMALHPGSAAVMSMDNAIDIMAAGVSKGNAMLQLARLIGVQPDQIVTLGDHDNDASMLRMSGLGIAMGNATPLAVAASQIQTLSHDLSGVAEAIRRYILPN